MTNEAPPRKWIELKPKFTDGNFDGYDQVAGTHYFDNVDQKYKFVPMAAYQALKEENERLKKSLDSLRIAHRYEVAETVHAAKRALDFSAGEKLKLHDRITQLGQEILKLTGIKIKELEI